MSDTILILKSVHLISMVAWFAALFYLPRLFVYHVEALEHNNDQTNVLTGQFEIMEQRLYRIIMNPAMMITWTAGLVMLFLYGTDWLKLNHWVHIKLTLLIILTGYHVYLKKIMKNLKNKSNYGCSKSIRLINEIPTILLIAITLLAVMRNNLNYIYFSLFLAVCVVVLISLSKKYSSQLKN